MENKNLPAFPPNAGWEHSEAKGLTKREYFAAMAMQGILTNPNFTSGIYSPEEKVQLSVECADMLLAELEK